MTDDWEKLGQEVRERRQALGFTQTDVQARGGPSTALLRGIENATSKTLSRSKRRDLERALNWPPGHVDAVLAGDPTQDTLLDYEPPQPKLRPVVNFDDWVARAKEIPSTRALTLDALSALEAAANALRLGNTNDAIARIDRAQESLAELLRRSFDSEEQSDARLRLLAEPHFRKYVEAALRAEERAVANEDDTLEQISEDQQQEP